MYVFLDVFLFLFSIFVFVLYIFKAFFECVVYLV